VGSQAAAVVVAAALVVLFAACSSAPPTPAPTSAARTSAGSSTSTGTGCPRTSLSTGPITSQVVVVTTSAMSAPAGSVLSVTTDIVVLSDGPPVVARPQWSALEVLGRGAVVARAVGSPGADVPTPITRGTTVPATTVPTAITLTGCDGRPLAPGAYRLRALVGYHSGSDAGYVMASEPVDLTVT
jgi:hypothetical protein